MVIEVAIYCLLFLELMLVGWIDFKTKKISNKWTVVNLVMAAIFLMFSSIGPTLSLYYFLYPAIIFGLGFLLYLVKVMGAGDVKFLASFLLILSVHQQKIFVDGLLYMTILVGFMFITINTIKHSKFIISCVLTKTFNGVGSLFGRKFSYAPVILLAWIYFGWVHYR